MGRTLDWLAAGLLLAAAFSIALSVLALDREQDRRAFYWLLLGALALKSSTDLFRPKKSS
jgi:hypothetical protein